MDRKVNEYAFYWITYKKQFNRSGVWEDTAYKNQQIIVIANDYNFAKQQIITALKTLENKDYRAFLTSRIKKGYVLYVSEGFEGSTHIYPFEFNDSQNILEDNELKFEEMV